ncbi:MAG: LytTR family DNA-binding domain-containing protein [Mobilitalea sp.]
MRIAICDDSLGDIEKIESLLDLINDIEIDYDVFQSAEEMLRYIKKDTNQYQMYIFDIDLPGMNGLELAAEIRKNDKKALFVFLTSYDLYMKDVFDVVTFDFINKPVTISNLKKVLDKATKYLGLIKQNFYFSYRQNKFVLSCDDIVYIEKMGRQARIHTKSELYNTNLTLAELWKQLDAKMFAHIHTSLIVNLGQIKEIVQYELVLKNEEVLYIARSHKQKLKEKHLQFMEEMM